MRNKSSLLMMLMVTAAVAAEGGSGTEGGGRTVDYYNRPALRDLHDKTNCVYLPMKDFVTDATEFGGTEEFSKILQSVGDVHWYLARAIRSELEHLTICETQAPLIRIPAEDVDDVALATVGETEDSEQVAVRLNDKVFIDMTILNRAHPLDQAYIIVHEILHSFIPMKTPRRNNRLRSFVATIRRHQVKPMSLARFALQMRENSLTVPANSPLVSSAETHANFDLAFNPDGKNLERMIAAGKLVKEQIELLPADQTQLSRILQFGYARLAKAVHDNDLVLTQKFLDSGYTPFKTDNAFSLLFTPDDAGYSSEHLDLSIRIHYHYNTNIGCWPWESSCDKDGDEDGIYQLRMPFIKLAGRKNLDFFIESSEFGLLLSPVVYNRPQMLKLLIRYADERKAQWVEEPVKIFVRNRKSRLSNGAVRLVDIAKYLGYDLIVSSLREAGAEAPDDIPLRAR